MFLISENVSGSFAYTFRLVLCLMCLITSTYVPSGTPRLIRSLLRNVFSGTKSTGGERTRTIHIATVFLCLSELPLRAWPEAGFEPASSALTDCSAILELLRHVTPFYFALRTAQDNRRADNYPYFSTNAFDYSDTARIVLIVAVPSRSSWITLFTSLFGALTVTSVCTAKKQ